MSYIDFNNPPNWQSKYFTPPPPPQKKEEERRFHFFTMKSVWHATITNSLQHSKLTTKYEDKI